MPEYYVCPKCGSDWCNIQWNTLDNVHEIRCGEADCHTLWGIAAVAI